MSVSAVGERRIEFSARTVGLAVGDVAAIGLFVVLGEYTHGIDPFAAVGRVAGTLAPFLIGWFLVAGVGGLYAGTATRSVRTAVVSTVVAWVLAVAIAQGLRATALFHGGAALTFALVSVLVGGTLLVAWRGLATWIDGRE